MSPFFKNIDYLDLDDSIEGGVYPEAVNAEYDSDDNRFVGKFYLDTNSYVFFIAYETVEKANGEKEEVLVPEDCYLGTEADLADGESYDIFAKYADKKADDNNIVVVKDIAGSAGRKAGLAVLTSVGTSENEDGEQIYAIEALVNGEEIAADTTAEVYEKFSGTKAPDLTAGDIVKVKVDANGVVTAINLVFDLAEDVRAKYDEDAKLADYALAFSDAYYTATGDEAIVGGVVENYRKTSSTATIGGEGYKLSNASNIIVIDANGRKLEVKKGSASNFKTFDALYAEDADKVDVTIGDALYEGVDVDDAKVAADYVFVREYDGRVTDVVIVKGVEDMKVREAKDAK